MFLKANSSKNTGISFLNLSFWVYYRLSNQESRWKKSEKYVLCYQIWGNYLVLSLFMTGKEEYTDRHFLRDAALRGSEANPLFQHTVFHLATGKV